VGASPWTTRARSSRANGEFDGYWAQPGATAENFGGLVPHGRRRLTAGFPDHLGSQEGRDRHRQENVVLEVEDCLTLHPDVAEAAVIGVPDERWGETIKAIVVLAAGAAATERELIEHCRAHLAHYKCPTSIELVDTLARTATGKVQKFKLRAPYWEGRVRLVN
jgi:hypothetical protein